MAIYYRQIDDIIIVSGKTYPYKDIIKSCGGRFQGADKVWAIPISDTSLEEIKKLCKRVGGGPLKETTAPKPSSRAVATEAPISEPVEQVVDGISISELMTKVSLHIQQSFPRAVWIVGEIQSLSRRHTGTYLQLADIKEGHSKSATMTANSTLWRSTMEALQGKLKGSLDELLQEGMKIRALVQVGFYKDRGSVSLNILDIDPSFTKGALALAREQLLKELRAKGLDRKNKVLRPAIMPFKIGLLSAKGSRAESDFLDQLKLYAYPGEVIFIPTQMQGEKTIKDVLAGIKSLEEQGCDYVVITRGGGSQADLRWFDDREIALAIANCPIPVLTAIGHHDDVCVAEDVSFRREKTPTAAADYILSCFAAAKERLENASQQVYKLASQRLQYQSEIQIQQSEKLKSYSSQFLSQMSEHLSFLSGQIQSQHHRSTSNIEGQLQSFRQALNLWSQKHLNRHEQFLSQVQFKISETFQGQVNGLERTLNGFAHEIKLGSQGYLARQEQQLNTIYTAVVSKDPSPWLKQGWTQLVQNQKKLLSVKDIDPNEPIQARLLDGKIQLKITEDKKDPS